jgi:DNA-directed RNA polymerase sigma subunit (sigma70/sigma32)
MADARIRRGLVWVLRANGATFAEIGEAIGVSLERARQLELRADGDVTRAVDARQPELERRGERARLERVYSRWFAL